MDRSCQFVCLSVRVSTCRFTKAALTLLWQLPNKPQSPHNAGVREVVASASTATRWQENNAQLGTSFKANWLRYVPSALTFRLRIFLV